MKKISIRLGIFLVSFILLYISAIFVVVKLRLDSRILNHSLMNNGSYGNTLSKFRDLTNNKNKLDILFLGSSHVYRTFDTRFYQQKGLNTINLGTSSQSIINTYFVTKDIIREKKPKVVVIDTYWEMLNNSHDIESATDLVCNTPTSVNVFHMVVYHKNIKLVNTFLFEYIKRFLGNSIDKRTDYESSDDIYIQGGFVQSLHKQQISIIEPKNLKNSIVIQQTHLTALEQLIQICQQVGVQVILVRTPCVKEVVQSITNYQETIMPINKISEKYQVPFIDYNQYEWNTMYDFYDPTHFTQTGVEKFNPIFYKHYLNCIKNEQ